MRAVIIRLAEDNKQTLGEFILYDGIERVFSCKTFDPQIVKDIMREYFDISNYKEYYLSRQA